jgi:ribonuclease VapC
LGVDLPDADWELARGAARFKTQAKMSYADCFAAAMAKKNKGELATGDREFKQVEGELSIAWFA